MTGGPAPDRLVQKYGGANAHAIGAKLAETLEIFGTLAGHHAVLDIGCGPGRMATAIGERFGWTNSYLGFDIVQEDVAFCAREIAARHPNFHFQRVNVRNALYNPRGTIDPAAFRFPSDDRQYDFALATSVFTHMRTPETLVYLGEALRCLRPGGRLFATFFCMEDGAIDGRPPRFTFSTQLDEHCWTAMPERPEKVIGYRRDFVEESLARAGYTEIQFTRGAWSGRPARHSQDFFVAKRA